MDLPRRAAGCYRCTEDRLVHRVGSHRLGPACGVVDSDFAEDSRRLRAGPRVHGAGLGDAECSVRAGPGGAVAPRHRGTGGYAASPRRPLIALLASRVLLEVGVRAVASNADAVLRGVWSSVHSAATNRGDARRDDDRYLSTHQRLSHIRTTFESNPPKVGGCAWPVIWARQSGVRPVCAASGSRLCNLCKAHVDVRCAVFTNEAFRRPCGGSAGHRI
jgi:hypothetical protein